MAVNFYKDTGFSAFLVKLDKVCDKIPLVSSISYLFDLALQKIVLPVFKKLGVVSKETLLENYYCSHIQHKDMKRDMPLLIPIVGNIYVHIKDTNKTAMGSGMDALSTKTIETADQEERVILANHLIRDNPSRFLDNTSFFKLDAPNESALIEEATKKHKALQDCVSMINDNPRQALKRLGMTSVEAMKTLLTQYGSEIKSLDLTDLNVKDEDLKIIAAHCPNLEHIVISSVHLFGVYFSDADSGGLAGIIRNCPKLKTLDLGGCKNLHMEDEDIKLIAKNLPSLKTLNLMGCRLELGIPGVEALGLNFPALRSLSLNAIRYPNDPNAFLYIIKKHPNLTSFACNSSSLPKEFPLDVVRLLPNLNSLGLPYVSRLSPEFFQFVTESMPYLTSLDLSHSEISDVCVQGVKSSSNFLKTINLSDCKGISGALFKRLGRIFPQITELDLSDNDRWLTADILKEMSRHLPDLKVLNLSSCFIFEKRNSTRPYDCCKIIAEKCTKLSSLILSRNRVLDEDVKELVMKLPNLTMLDISSSHSITTACIEWIGKHPGMLQQLNATRCWGIDSEKAMEIAKQQPNVDMLFDPVSPPKLPYEPLPDVSLERILQRYAGQY